MISVNLLVYQLIISPAPPCRSARYTGRYRGLPRPRSGTGPSSGRHEEGNPKNITSITDLTRDGLKIALGDVNATAIGKAPPRHFSNGSLSLHSSQERYVTHGISFSYLISFALRISPLNCVLFHLVSRFPERTMRAVLSGRSCAVMLANCVCLLNLLKLLEAVKTSMLYRYASTT